MNQMIEEQKQLSSSRTELIEQLKALVGSPNFNPQQQLSAVMMHFLDTTGQPILDEDSNAPKQKRLPDQVPLQRAIDLGAWDIFEAFTKNASMPILFSLSMSSTENESVFERVVKHVSNLTEENKVVKGCEILFGKFQQIQYSDQDVKNLLNQISNKKLTAIHRACRYGAVKVLALLLEKGGEPVVEEDLDDNDVKVYWSSQAVACNQQDETIVLAAIKAFQTNKISLKKAPTHTYSCMEILAKWGHVKALAALAKTDALSDLFIEREGKTPHQILQDKNLLEGFEAQLKANPFDYLNYLKFQNRQQDAQEFFESVAFHQTHQKTFEDYFSDSNKKRLEEVDQFLWKLLITTWEARLNQPANPLPNSFLRYLIYYFLNQTAEGHPRALCVLITFNHKQNEDIEQYKKLMKFILNQLLKQKDVNIITELKVQNGLVIDALIQAWVENHKSALQQAENNPKDVVLSYMEDFPPLSEFSVLKPYLLVAWIEGVLTLKADNLNANLSKLLYELIWEAGLLTGFVGLTANPSKAPAHIFKSLLLVLNSPNLMLDGLHHSMLESMIKSLGASEQTTNFIRRMVKEYLSLEFEQNNQQPFSTQDLNSFIHNLDKLIQQPVFNAAKLTIYDELLNILVSQYCSPQKHPADLTALNTLNTLYMKKLKPFSDSTYNPDYAKLLAKHCQKNAFIVKNNNTMYKNKNGSTANDNNNNNNNSNNRQVQVPQY